MDDLKLVIELRPDFPLPELDDLEAARGRLSAVIATETAGRTAGGRAAGTATRRRAPGPRRRAVYAAGAAVAAAAVAGGTLAGLAGRGAPVIDRPSGGTPLAGRTPSVHVTKPVPSPPARQQVSLAAKVFLDTAAAAVLRQHATAAPAPGQFVYSETKTKYGQTYQIWLSSDGSQPGVIINGQGRSPQPACTVTQARRTGCYLSAGYLPEMPTALHALREFLVSTGLIAGTQSPPIVPGWAANDLGKAVDTLMSTTYLLPAQQAALYRLLAITPGFTIVHGVRDALGQPGVGIRWAFAGSTGEIILNPVTYAYLGDRTTGAVGSPRLYDGDVLVEQAVVPGPGQLP